MPFADDLSLADMPDISGRLFVIGTFERPERFQLDLIGAVASVKRVFKGLCLSD